MKRTAKIPKTDVKRAKARYDEQNLEAARIIAADPVNYLGGMQDWAASVLARFERPTGRQVGNGE